MSFNTSEDEDSGWHDFSTQPALKEEPHRLDEVDENIVYEHKLRKGRTPPPGKLPVWRSRGRPPRPNTRIR